jgi:CRISPR-associated protein Csm3
MRLIMIHQLEGTLEVVSGLRIGASEGEMRIGGVDNQVIRHPVSGEPYIPGSSLKGRIRSLLEWWSGAVQPGPLGTSALEKIADSEIQARVRPILKLFGVSGDHTADGRADGALGPTRLSFWDATLDEKWLAGIGDAPRVEVKTENQIDRIKGVAQYPRQTERVPAGTQFRFRVSIKELDSDSREAQMDMLFRGLRLLEMDSLGGSGSRGYGKVRFASLFLDGEDVLESFRKIEPFSEQASA